MRHVARRAVLRADEIWTGITMGIRLLAVVYDGRLMGTISRADVCWGVLVEQPRRRAATVRRG